MSKKLSVKHRLFAKNLIKTKGDNKKAYKITYPNASDVTAKNRGSELVRTHPEIKEFLVETLNKKGLPLDNLVGKLKRLTSAKKELVQPSGEVVKVVDNPTRLQAVKTGLEMHGALRTSTSINTDNRSININLEGKDTRELKTLSDKLDQLNNALQLDVGMQDGEIIDGDFSTTDETSELD